MTDTIRDLLTSLASHVAYMQGQLEARHELDDPEDYYWYRESVLLRQKVTDALTDEPAVPQGREPASVTGQPSDEELADTYWKAWHEYHDRTNSVLHSVGLRAVLARWGNPAPQPPADGEVAELAEMLKGIAYWRLHGTDKPTPFDIRQAARLTRAAELLQRQVLVPVPEVNK